MVQTDGTPIKFSWKWPEAGDGNGDAMPEVRYNYEAIGTHAGTELDPLCQLAAKELMSRLAAAMPDVHMDNSWSHHLMSAMFDHDNSKLAAAAARGERIMSSVLMAAEFDPKGVVGFKTYVQPRFLAYPTGTPVEVYEKAMASIEPGTESLARAAVLDFLGNSAEGNMMRPFSVGVDNNSNSRLKWYFTTPHTSFASVRSIMTLDGRISTPHIKQQLASLDALVKAVLGLPEDFPDDQHATQFLGATSSNNFLPPSPPRSSHSASSSSSSSTSSRTTTPSPPPTIPPSYPYYFDIAPGQSLPSVKWNLPVRHFNRDDLTVAKALTTWMEKQGRGTHYSKQYMALLQKLAAEKDMVLQECHGLQEFISIMFQPDGQIALTTYFSGHAFGFGQDKSQLMRQMHLTGRRATRRRGEDY